MRMGVRGSLCACHTLTRFYPRYMQFAPQEAYAQNAAIPSRPANFDSLQGVGAFRIKRVTFVTYGQLAFREVGASITPDFWDRDKLQKIPCIYWIFFVPVVVGQTGGTINFWDKKDRI